MPMNRAMAGSAQTPNMIRHRPSTWPSVALRTALTENAANWPTTIASSLRPVIEPRISYGASSARYTGTTVEAPPTARPRMIRPETTMTNPGAVTTSTTPRKNITDSTMIVVRRPIASESRPPMSAPNAAAKTSELMTMPVCNSVRPSSSLIGPSAPLETPVS